MEEGQNSAWLLPNRIYESSLFGVIPIALSHVETGRVLQSRVVVVTLQANSDLEAVLQAMTPQAYAELAARQARAPLSDFVADRADCRALVAALGA